MRVTVTIYKRGEEVARIVFPNKETYYAAWMVVQLPYTYTVEWEEE